MELIAAAGVRVLLVKKARQLKRARVVVPATQAARVRQLERAGHTPATVLAVVVVLLLLLGMACTVLHPPTAPCPWAVVAVAWDFTKHLLP